MVDIEEAAVWSKTGWTLAVPVSSPKLLERCSSAQRRHMLLEVYMDGINGCGHEQEVIRLTDKSSATAACKKWCLHAESDEYPHLKWMRHLMGRATSIAANSKYLQRTLHACNLTNCKSANNTQFGMKIHKKLPRAR